MTPRPARVVPRIDADAESPLAALARPRGRPLHVAILSDFVRVSYANGAVFQTRFLQQALVRAGHRVTIVGPHDPDAAPGDVAADTICLPSVPVRSYPGLHMPLPLARWVFDPARWSFDLVFGQTTSLLLELGVWLRRVKGIPLLSVHTTLLEAAYDSLLPTEWSHPLVHAGARLFLEPPYLRLYTGLYNGGDALIVLCDGLARTWRLHGVTVPIHVVPRAVSPEIFDRPLGADPYPPRRGPRLLCAGRLVHEKSQDRVLAIFARHVLPRRPDATLTLVGDGPAAGEWRRLAADLGVADSVRFAGEQAQWRMRDWYGHADAFLHASLTETYGNVLGEALWNGLPVVAFADGMGASYQIRDGVNGILVPPGRTAAERAEADRAFGGAVVELLARPELGHGVGQRAAMLQRERSAPHAVEAKLAATFAAAIERARRARRAPAGVAAAFPHFRRWLLGNGAVWLAGRLRSDEDTLARRPGHPQLGG